MTPDFCDRFAAGPANPPGLQLLYPDPPDLDPAAVEAVLRTYHPDLAAAAVELVDVARAPTAAKLISADGPPASVLGLLEWGCHRVKLAAFHAPMPYGPVETCVGPALMDPALKAEAKRHTAHVLLFYAGSHPDPLEQYVALAAAAGALARLGASVVLHEEARTAVPAHDLVPDPEEDALDTLRRLPVPYLWSGFVRLDVGDPRGPWARTFASHRLGLPDLARHLAGFHETADTFKLFAGMLGYLTRTGERFEPGDTIDLAGEGKLRLREPTGDEWFLESDGTMLVVEPEPDGN
jgi:hypothetical protein